MPGKSHFPKSSADDVRARRSTIARGFGSDASFRNALLTNRDDGRPAAPPSARLRVGTHDTVVIGVATDDVSTYGEAMRPSLSVADPVAWARANLPALLGAAPVKIVLSHAGLKADRAMLPLVPDGACLSDSWTPTAQT
jgi:2',3'-cyclic-nucleotide 2'-phosphodiesterase (5'-nucleotidase family)